MDTITLILAIIGASTICFGVAMGLAWCVVHLRIARR